jgi:hypothetical protein
VAKWCESRLDLLVAGPDGGLLPAKQSRSGEGGEAWREELFAIGRLMALAVTAKVQQLSVSNVILCSLQAPPFRQPNRV